MFKPTLITTGALGAAMLALTATADAFGPVSPGAAGAANAASYTAVGKVHYVRRKARRRAWRWVYIAPHGYVKVYGRKRYGSRKRYRGGNGNLDHDYVYMGGRYVKCPYCAVF